MMKNVECEFGRLLYHENPQERCKRCKWDNEGLEPRKMRFDVCSFIVVPKVRHMIIYIWQIPLSMVLRASNIVPFKMCLQTYL